MSERMRLPYLCVFVFYILYSVEAQMQVFIGQGSNSLYFVLRITNEWDWGLSYCHNHRLMPGSIETEQDHQLITNFLNTSTSIEDEFRFLWLPATDHRKEGTFQWMWNMNEVAVGSWAPGMPSMNRTANCLAINRLGQFIEESCYNSGRRYYTLCEAQNFYYGSRDVSDHKISYNDGNTPHISSLDAKINKQLIDGQLQALIAIGRVGNVIYFANDQEISWTESLDLCHSAELRLATPEQPEQLKFIQEYADQQGTIFNVGGTDRLSVSCSKSNTEFRWFYSGNPIANQTNLNGDSYWYLCTCMSPSGLFTTGCAKGGGAFARSICELTILT